ncbi:Urease accessory protein UreH [Aquisphaera giovannonii]|uniref:Urease accessory protein UreH n=1 Tax=Aquisphaera giovannonii TaxID=406548 RepID=A0A5B9WF97_9BACT|nr:Urease accessory protein UreH [Aquisphaera giovannonii]
MATPGADASEACSYDEPELDPYRDEPKQLPSGSPGKDARLRLRFERRGGRSILAAMERRAPLLVQRALYCDEGMPHLPWVYVITNSGGILQGDRYRIRIEAGPGAIGHVTTQAATKIHEMDANFAAQDQSIVLEEGSYLEYLPDAVIPFRHSRFLTRTAIHVHPTATLLYSEILWAGRKHYRGGEGFEYDLFSSSVRAARPGGEPLFAEKFLIEPGRSSPRGVGVMGEFDVFANVILLTPKAHAERIAEAFPTGADASCGCVDGVSRLPNDAGLIYKALAGESSVARSRVRAFWAAVRGEVTGHDVPPAFPWS